MSEQHPQTQGGRLLKRGDTFDPECHRTTYRLGRAALILRQQGIEPTWTHRNMAGDTEQPGALWPGGPKHQCNYRCSCEWPPEVDGAVFDAAYRLADALQSARGAYHQREINRARSAR